MDFELFVAPRDHPSQRAKFLADTMPHGKAVDISPPMDNWNAVPPAIAHQRPLRDERVIRADDQLRLVLTNVSDQRSSVKNILPLAFEVILLDDRLADTNRLNCQRLELGIGRE